MQYEEHYLVTTTAADGSITSEKFDDMSEALEDYTLASRCLEAGTKVELRRYTSVMLWSAMKAARP